MTKKSKQAAAAKPSQHLGTIIQSLQSNPEGMSTGELAHVLGIKPKTASEILSKEVKLGNLDRREVDDQGTVAFRFFVPTNVTKGDPNDGEDDDAANDLMADGDAVADADLLEGTDEAPAKKKSAAKKEAKRPRATNETRGRGNPDAKKAINPQQTLEDKKKIAREAGGSMTWANRTWTIKTEDKTYEMSSREIAQLSLAEFRKAIGAPAPAVKAK